MKIIEVLRKVRVLVEKGDIFICHLAADVQGIAEGDSCKYYGGNESDAMRFIRRWMNERWDPMPHDRLHYCLYDEWKTAETYVAFMNDLIEGKDEDREPLRQLTRTFRLAWIDEMIAELERNGE